MSDTLIATTRRPTLHDSKDLDSLICQFMGMVDDFFRDKTDLKVLGYNETPTDSKRVIRLSVFITWPDYEIGEDDAAWARELSAYSEAHRFPWSDDDESEGHSEISAD